MGKKAEASVGIRRVRGIIEGIKSEEILLKLVVDGEDISRDFCWDEARAEEFIKSRLIQKTEKAQPLFFIDKGITHDEGTQIEVVDGKQSLKALLDFYEDKVRLDGKYFSEQSIDLQNEFMDFVFTLLTLPTRDSKKIRTMYADARGLK